MWTPWRRRRSEAPGADSTPASPAALPQASAWLQRLEWTVMKRLHGQLQGDFRSLFRGTGLDLADLREYQPHDDVRHIDWNVTARLQVPHVREHHEDRELAAWFLVDLSGSVQFGSGPTSKRELALQATAVLAALLSRQGNRVGLILHTGAGPRAQVIVPPRTGRTHLLQMLHRLQHTPPAGATQHSDLASWLRQAQSLLRQPAMLLVVSDFIAPDGWQQPLSELSRRHELLALRLQDVVEQQLPAAGLVWLQDAETGEQMLLDLGDRALRERFAAQALARDEALTQSLQRAGADHLTLRTDEAVDRALLRLVQRRRRTARQAMHQGRVHA